MAFIEIILLNRVELGPRMSGRGNVLYSQCRLLADSDYCGRAEWLRRLMPANDWLNSQL